jgi:hypothetical protein
MARWILKLSFRRKWLITFSGDRGCSGGGRQLKLRKVPAGMTVSRTFMLFIALIQYAFSSLISSAQWFQSLRASDNSVRDLHSQPSSTSPHHFLHFSQINLRGLSYQYIYFSSLSQVQSKPSENIYIPNLQTHHEIAPIIIIVIIHRHLSLRSASDHGISNLLILWREKSE